VSCALSSRDGPRSVELASNNARGPPIAARLSDTATARMPVASTSTPATRIASRRQRALNRFIDGAARPSPPQGIASLQLHRSRRDDET
jgi:hypothetical protein